MSLYAGSNVFHVVGPYMPLPLPAPAGAQGFADWARPMALHAPKMPRPTASGRTMSRGVVLVIASHRIPDAASRTSPRFGGFSMRTRRALGVGDAARAR